MNGCANKDPQEMKQPCDFENAAHAKHMSQQKASIDEATGDSENSADAERSIFSGFTNTVAIPTIQAEWVDNGKTLILRHSPLMLSWAYTIHKSQGKTLDLAIIYLGKIEKC